MNNQNKKIAIIGGTGKVGRHLAAIAIKNGYQVRMLVRNPEKITYKDEKIEIVEGHVQNIETLRELLKDCDFVINTFGQPSKEVPIYSSVTKNILEIMNELKISRYIGVSGGSLTISSDKKSIVNRFGAKLLKLLFANMIKDKKWELEILNRNKEIDWTLIRLPFVKDSFDTQVIKENLINMPGTKITNQDIANFIIDQLEKAKYVHKSPFISH